MVSPQRHLVSRIEKHVKQSQHAVRAATTPLLSSAEGERRRTCWDGPLRRRTSFIWKFNEEKENERRWSTMDAVNAFNHEVSLNITLLV